MFSSLRRYQKNLLIALSLCLILLAGIGTGYLTSHVLSPNSRFQHLAWEIFQEELSGSLMNLHYSLAHPEKKGISRPAPSLGTVHTDMQASCLLWEKHLKELKAFSPSALSRQNQITLDMLLLYFQTQLSSKDYVHLEEMLSPTLGIQAQLPVLLAEYAFYEDQDIADYLNLLSSVEPYFQSILDFQEEKSKAGFFMSDQTLDRIQQQCMAFIADPDSNYMLEIFSRKLTDYGKFSEKDCRRLIACHNTLVKKKVIPAYQKLIQGLESLRGTGVSSRGLAHFPGGKKYYEYLLKSQTGSYVPVSEIQQRLTNQLSLEIQTMQSILKEQPTLLKKLQNRTSLISSDPLKILQTLNTCIKKDFPDPGKVSYEVRNVHASMEEFLSPAFYLTPPLDTGTPNVIYINQGQQPSGAELFSTLAHEGFPGHLYQTVYFGSTHPSDIRYLLSWGGYTEGWATYVESFVPIYANHFFQEEAAQDTAALYWTNRSINLCIYSLLDIGIHYQGWSLSQSSRFLAAFGIRDSTVAKEIFQYIVETPGNYLKYYWGYLNFLDLRTAQQEALGADFRIKEFHQQILEIGPVPFPVLKKYLSLSHYSSR